MLRVHAYYVAKRHITHNEDGTQFASWTDPLTPEDPRFPTREIAEVFCPKDCEVLPIYRFKDPND